MKTISISRLSLLLVVVALLLPDEFQGQAKQQNNETYRFTTVKPDSVGFSPERLDLLDTTIQKIVAEHQLAGAVTLLARHGKVVAFNTYGYQDISRQVPMRKDSIFRLYSQTKPVTGVAMMILYEEGKWQFDDPISKFIPKFANLKVLKGVDPQGHYVLENPTHPPTMRELMTHTAGFAYGLSSDNPVDKAYAQQQVLQSTSLQEMIDKLSKIPLLYQPGTRWTYSISVDIQGYLVEKLSGKSLPEFMRDRVFQPLQMKDTAFYVPPDKVDRLVTTYEWDDRGNEVAPAKTVLLGINYLSPPETPSPGAGLVTTAEDFFRFAQMILNGGELDGVRILAPRTVQLLCSNHLPEELMTRENGIGLYHFGPGVGFAIDMPVVVDSLKAGTLSGDGSLTWGGAGQTWFWVDPTYDVVFVGMIQLFGLSPNNMDAISRTLVYQALLNPQK